MKLKRILSVRSSRLWSQPFSMKNGGFVKRFKPRRQGSSVQSLNRFMIFLVKLYNHDPGKYSLLEQLKFFSLCLWIFSIENVFYSQTLLFFQFKQQNPGMNTKRILPDSIIKIARLRLSLVLLSVRCWPANVSSRKKWHKNVRLPRLVIIIFRAGHIF